jgi:hypothetical protein
MLPVLHLVQFHSYFLYSKGIIMILTEGRMEGQVGSGTGEGGKISILIWTMGSQLGVLEGNMRLMAAEWSLK